MSGPTERSKKTIKRKLIDESILKKARSAIGLSIKGGDDEDDSTANDEPSLKWRKPRHNTPEGKVYVQNKEKRKQQDGVQTSDTFASPEKTNKKGSKNKKQKKKKKTTLLPVENKASETPRNPDSEKKHAMEALSYLQLWSSNRDHWKFEKLKQTWLLKNCLNTNLVDDVRFELLLEYIGSVKGAARKTTLMEMQTLVTKYEMTGGNNEGYSKDTKLTANESGKDNVDQDMYDRARQIIQTLVDE